MKIQIKNSREFDKIHDSSVADFLDVFGKRKRARVDLLRRNF